MATLELAKNVLTCNEVVAGTFAIDNPGTTVSNFRLTLEYEGKETPAIIEQPVVEASETGPTVINFQFNSIIIRGPSDATLVGRACVNGVEVVDRFTYTYDQTCLPGPPIGSASFINLIPQQVVAGEPFFLFSSSQGGNPCPPGQEPNTIFIDDVQVEAQVVSLGIGINLYRIPDGVTAGTHTAYLVDIGCSRPPTISFTVADAPPILTLSDNGVSDCTTPITASLALTGITPTSTVTDFQLSLALPGGCSSPAVITRPQPRITSTGVITANFTPIFLERSSRGRASGTVTASVLVDGVRVSASATYTASSTCLLEGITILPQGGVSKCKPFSVIYRSTASSTDCTGFTPRTVYIDGKLVPTQSASIGDVILFTIPPGTFPGNHAIRIEGLDCNVFEQSFKVLPTKNLACTGADPHIVCLDGSRLDVYDAGYYRMFDNLHLATETPVVVNASIVRDPRTHEDLYQSVWLKIGTYTETLSFSTKGIRSSKTGVLTSTWQQSYSTPQDTTYTLRCEAAQHTVGLKIQEGGQGYCGLLAGQIVRLPNLESVKVIGLPTVRSNFHYNALLCGSMRPHVVTVQKQILRPRASTYRFLQYPGGCLNVTLDYSGQVRAAQLHREGKEVVSWEWQGMDHWALTCFQDGVARSCNYMYEKEVIPGLLLRVQANGSVSCACRSLDVMTGLATGDFIEVGLNESEAVLLPTQSSSEDVRRLTSSSSMYERLIAPIVV